MPQPIRINSPTPYISTDQEPSPPSSPERTEIEANTISEFVKNRPPNQVYSTPTLVRSCVHALDFDAFFKHIQQQVWCLDSAIWRRVFQAPKSRDKARCCACCGLQDGSEMTPKPKDILQQEIEHLEQHSRKRKRIDNDKWTPSSSNTAASANPPDLLCNNCYVLHQRRNQQLSLLHRLCGVAGQRKRLRNQ